MAGEDDIVFRAATAKDLPAIVAILADDELGQTREDPRLPLASVYADAFAAIDADPNQLLTVADDGSKVVGTLQLTFIPNISLMGAWRGQIEGVRVSPVHRGSGLGQRLFEWAIAQCRTRGCRMVQLTANKTRTDAHRFYERLGFKATHEGFKLTF